MAPVNFFSADEQLRARYERALGRETRLTVFLEGDTGLGKGQDGVAVRASR